MTDLKPRLILGSSSPRRLELLGQLGITPDLVQGADVDETPRREEMPDKYCLRVALDKNAVLAAQFPDDFILTADTTVAKGRRIMGKPADEREARAMLELLSGGAHMIFTAVVLKAPGREIASRLSATRVKVKRLSDPEIAMMLATREWEGVAGAYRLQGHFVQHVIQLQGSHTGVIGLPLYETMQLLKGAGYDYSL